MDASAISRSSPLIDIEPSVERPPDEPRYRPPRPIQRPTAASKPHREHRISELLRHRGRQLSQASRPDAKNTAASKVPVADHALQAHTRHRVDVRQLEAHLMGGLRLRHAVGGAPSRLLGRQGRELGSRGDQGPVLLKLTLTFVAPRSTRAAVARQAAGMTCTVEMAEVRPVRRWALFGCGPSKQACQASQVALAEKLTGSRAVAADGSDGARPRCAIA